jgi:predicted metal-binding membrane protein
VVARIASGSARDDDLKPAYSSVWTQRRLVALLFALAAGGWWWVVGEMRGMDDGSWTDLGSLGWFLSVWVVMMAAMMFPSISPTVALYARISKQRSPLLPLLFVVGYVAAWAVAGAVAFALRATIDATAGDVLAWNREGRWVAGVTLLIAAGYQLTPLKDVCLGKCRSPLGFILGSWRDGRSGALRMGAQNGAWCVGCCWALMLALFALGIMSVVWMAVVAGFIAVEKTLPWRRTATLGTAAILVGLGLLVLFAPGALPGFTTPGSTMHDMPSMGSSEVIMVSAGALQ